MTALKKRILALAAGIATVASASAKIELPTLMSDNMVLQQQTDSRLWGKANAGGAVSPLEEWLDGFEAAGEDGVYHPARAMVELATGTLTVYCDEVKEIKKVRYGYRPYFEASLFDNFGLPATPFVTTGEVE